MSIKVNTDVIDYLFKAKSVDANKDIVLLTSEMYRGLFTIGTDHKLYAYDEQTASGGQFIRRRIYDNCDQFAAARMGNTEYFAMALISGDAVYTCVTKEPNIVEAQSFEKLDFSSAFGSNELKPVDLFVNCNKKEVSIAVVMKNASGRIEQFVAYFTVNRPTTFTYYALPSNFDTIINAHCGRADKQMVDGVYTLGTYGESDQLLYIPMTNIFSSLPPDPIRLSIPNTGLESIGLCNLENGYTHLFGIGEQSLFFYPYKKQYDFAHFPESNYTEILRSEYFFNPLKIESYVDNENQKLYIWILNKRGTLSYTFAAIDSDNKCGDFVEPIICKRNVVFFEAKPDTLVLCTESKLLFGSLNKEMGGYSFSEVTIQTNIGEASKKRAFATKIITDKPYEKIRLSANVPVEAYINNVYYRFTDLIVEADPMGVINVIQNADGISPPPFNVSLYSESRNSNETLEVYAGNEVYNRLLKLTTPEKLRKETVVDLHGNKTKLTEGLSDEQVQLAACTIKKLSESYRTIQLRRNGVRGTYRFSSAENDGLFDKIKHFLSEAWDFVCDKAKQFWDKTLGKVITFVTEIVSDVIHFVIKIGDKVLKFVLDTVGKVLKCAVKALEFIGIPVSKILDWMLAPLDIDGAVRAKNVLKCLAEKGHGQMGCIIDYANEVIENKLDEVISVIEQWSGLADVPEIETPGYSVSFLLRPSNMFFFDHIINQGGLLSVDLPIPKVSAELNILYTKALEELTILTDKYQHWDFYTVMEELTGIAEVLSKNVTLQDLKAVLPVLKKILGILGSDIIGVVKQVATCLFELFKAMLDHLWDILTQKIHIPFISTVLEYLGIPEFSVLDICCMLPAFFTNIVYRTATGKSLIAESDVEFYRNIDFSWISGSLSHSGSNLMGTNEWQKEYDLEEMAKATIPENDKAVIGLRVLLFGNTMISGMISIVQIFEEKNSIATHLVTGCSLLVGYSVSLGLGYGIWAPMNYNGEVCNKLYNVLFIAKGTFSIMFEGLQCVDENKGKVLNYTEKIVNNVFAVCSFICELIACIKVSQINLKEEISGYKMNHELLERDRNIYVYDTISYMLDDISVVFDSIAGMVKGGITIKAMLMLSRMALAMASGVLLMEGYFKNCIEGKNLLYDFSI